MGDRTVNKIFLLFKVLAVVCIAVYLVPAIVSTNYTPTGKPGKCMRELEMIRRWALAGKKYVGMSFDEWQELHKDLGLTLKGLMCEYCQQSFGRYGDFCKEVVSCKKIDGERRLIDPWGNEYNIGRKDELAQPLRNIRKDKRWIYIGDFILWSSGPNGMNELGAGDDVLVIPKVRLMEKSVDRIKEKVSGF